MKRASVLNVLYTQFIYTVGTLMIDTLDKSDSNTELYWMLENIL
jgi:hypothetical protein